MTARKAFVSLFLGNVALGLASPAFLPARVAVHFGCGGAPDRWASSVWSALVFAGLCAAIFCALLLSPRLTLGFGQRWVNLPHKDYWLRAENRPRAEALLSALMARFGAAVFLLLLAVQILVIRANLSDPVRLDEKIFLAALAAFLVFVALWALSFFRSFRRNGAQPTKGGAR